MIGHCLSCDDSKQEVIVRIEEVELMCSLESYNSCFVFVEMKEKQRFDFFLF